MKKYLAVGIVAFSLTITTVYALNDHNRIDESTTYNQNCPYYDRNEDCPYYDEVTDTRNCPNNKNGNCLTNYSNYEYGHGRHGGCHRHN